MPQLDTRLCLLLCIIPLVVADLIEEEERRAIDGIENDPKDHWKERKVPGKLRSHLVSSLQVLGDHQSLLSPPQPVAVAANQAATKARLFVSGITMGGSYFECLNMKETSIDNCK